MKATNSSQGAPVAVSVLSDLQLNWAIAEILGKNVEYIEWADCLGEIDPEDSIAFEPLRDYQGDWAHGGPVLQAHDVSFEPRDDNGRYWLCRTNVEGNCGVGVSRSQLRAAMLAVVNHHYGENVTVPDLHPA